MHTATRTGLADLIDFDDEPPSGRRPSRAERRAAASHPHDAAEPPRRRRGALGCLIGLVVVLALAVGAFFVLQGPITALIDRFTPAENYSGQGTGEVLFQVEEGDSGSSIGTRLVEQDIVASEAAFLEAIDDAPTAVTFYPGVFRLAQQMSAEAALAGLTDQSNRLENTILIREGMWADDVLAEVSAVLEIPMEELQAVAANPQALGLPPEATTLEGFLFPDTYTFDPGVTAQQVLQQMVDLSLRSFDEAGVAPEDRYRVATIAALIEREALPQDFGKVSRVIQNRLDDGMPLQFDSTVHYGIADHSDVTTSDAERADAGNPYNTYAHTGLPPGPIGNPGVAAIQAALNPEDGPWFYFVTVNPDTGETVFSTTYAEHEAAAQQFYRWLQERGDG
ncbi:endolytic transglycosylase MltG [Agromyces silvae]|uniref:endolytic transglycosylase MltG n=1 Tax=Agromyces silvae TaxID=3388266 RepID=UPI0035A013DD